jgi:hypothetical protein
LPTRLPPKECPTNADWAYLMLVEWVTAHKLELRVDNRRLRILQVATST